MFFDEMPVAPADAILGLTAAFKADPRATKANLGVGVFMDETGRTPILDVVKRAERMLLDEETSKTYLPIAGLPEFGEAVRRFVLGDAFCDGGAHGLATAQSLGGTGALQLGAQLLRRFRPGATVWLPTPTWGNHRAIFSGAGLAVRDYPYYATDLRRVDPEALAEALATIPAGDVVLLHACCHNPTGADLDAATWARVAATAAQAGWLPFFDFAYQGFGDGAEADRAGLLSVLRAVPEALVASSFSKNMGLYSERVGALTLVAGSAAAAEAGLSQLRRVVREIASNAQRHGGSIALKVLADPVLRADWLRELEAMRTRIVSSRAALVDGLRARFPDYDFSYLLRQKGMFSYCGLNDAQVAWLREQKAVYMVKGGRINVAGLLPGQLPYVCDSIAAALAQ